MEKNTKNNSFNQEFILSSFALMVSQEMEKIVLERTKHFDETQKMLEAKILHYSNIIHEKYGKEAQEDYDKWFGITRQRYGNVESTNKKRK